MIRLRTCKQKRGYCGPAALKIVLDFYGIHYLQQQLAKFTNTTPDGGCAEEDMVKFARKIGLKAYIKERSSLKELKKLNKKNIPVIIDWFSPEEAGHYSVIAGFRGDYIFIADPHFGKIMKRKIGWFEERWFDMPFSKYKSIREIIVIEKIK